ncbi:MAG: DUF4932 domain-containing protein [Sediminibacterium sp.]
MKKIFAFLVFVTTVSATHSQPKVTVTVHPGTELLSIIHFLSDTAKGVKSTYRKDIEQYFSKYKNHSAIKKAKELPFINCDFPVRLSWAFDNFPRLKLTAPTSLMGYEKYFTKDRVTDYFRACLAFSKDTRFSQFYKKYKPKYQQWVHSFDRNLQEQNLLTVLDSFYRFVPKKEIIITPGALNCGSYIVVDMKKLNPSYNNIMVIMVAYGNIAGNKANDETDPDFYAPIWTSQLVWHEMGHAYLDEIFEQNKDRINKLIYIFNRDSTMQKQAQNMGWSMYLNENITQTVTSYLRIKTGKMSEEKEMKRITGGPFYVFVPLLLEVIRKEYETPGKYADFKAFFPVLLTELEKKYPASL